MKPIKILVTSTRSSHTTEPKKNPVRKQLNMGTNRCNVTYAAGEALWLNVLSKDCKPDSQISDKLAGAEQRAELRRPIYICGQQAQWRDR